MYELSNNIKLNKNEYIYHIDKDIYNNKIDNLKLITGEEKRKINPIIRGISVKNIRNRAKNIIAIEKDNTGKLINENIFPSLYKTGRHYNYNAATVKYIIQNNQHRILNNGNILYFSNKD